MPTINNLYQFIESQNLTVNKFSKQIGVSNGYFSKQLSTGGAISSHILEKIVIEFPILNVEWLLTGKGEMLKNYKVEELSLVKEDDVLYNTLNESLKDKKRIIELLEAENARLKQLLRDNNK